ncbi:MAG TPA: hypothetical protein DDY98_07320 [Ruminococcaceae bacterium]|nr:hypothetical protein [Oscillospiraceae bacterium]
MIPDSMTVEDAYTPTKRIENAFAQQTVRRISEAMARVQVPCRAKSRLPAMLKLLVTVAFVAFIAVCQIKILLLGATAALLVSLCFAPAKILASILKSAFFAVSIAVILLFPGAILHPSQLSNSCIIALKIFLCSSAVALFNRTTQWNQITKALRQLRIPSVFVFTMDITLQYIAVLGRFLTNLLEAYRLRTVGHLPKSRRSVGGIMGVTFIRGLEMNREMVEAMQCRCFTDDYKGL